MPFETLKDWKGTWSSHMSIFFVLFFFDQVYNGITFSTNAWMRLGKGFGVPDAAMASVIEDWGLLTLRVLSTLVVAALCDSHFGKLTPFLVFRCFHCVHSLLMVFITSRWIPLSFTVRTLIQFVKMVADMALPAKLALMSDQIDSELHQFTFATLSCIVVLAMEIGVLTAFFVSFLVPDVIPEVIVRGGLLVMDMAMTTVCFIIRKSLYYERIVRGIAEQSIRCIFHCLKVKLRRSNDGKVMNHWLDNGLESYGTAVVENTKRLLGVAGVHVPMVIYQCINVLAEAIFLSQMKFLVRDSFTALGPGAIDVILIVSTLCFVVMLFFLLSWIPRHYYRHVTNLRAVGLGYLVLSMSLILLMTNQVKIDQSKKFPPRKHTSHLRVYNLLPTETAIEPGFSRGNPDLKHVEPFEMFLFVHSIQGMDEVTITISNVGANLKVTETFLAEEKQSQSLLVTGNGLTLIRRPDDLELDIWERPTLVVFCALNDSDCNQSGTVDLPSRDDYLMYLVEGQGKRVQLVPIQPRDIRPDPERAPLPPYELDLFRPVAAKLRIDNAAVYALIFFTADGNKNVTLLRVVGPKAYSESIEIPFIVTSTVGFLTFEIFILSHLMSDRPPAMSCMSFSLFALALTIPPMLLINPDTEYRAVPCLVEICISMVAFMFHILMALRYLHNDIPHSLERDRSSLGPPLKSALKKSVIEPTRTQRHNPWASILKNAKKQERGRLKKTNVETKRPPYLSDSPGTSIASALLAEPKPRRIPAVKTKRLSTSRPPETVGEAGNLRPTEPKAVISRLSKKFSFIRKIPSISRPHLNLPRANTTPTPSRPPERNAPPDATPPPTRAMPRPPEKSPGTEPSSSP